MAVHQNVIYKVIKWNRHSETLCVGGGREREFLYPSLYSKCVQAILSLECLLSGSALFTWVWREWAWAAAQWRSAWSWAAGWDLCCWWDPWCGRQSGRVGAGRSRSASPRGGGVRLGDGRAQRALPGGGRGYTVLVILHIWKELNTTNKNK